MLVFVFFATTIRNKHALAPPNTISNHVARAFYKEKINEN